LRQVVEPRQLRLHSVVRARGVFVALEVFRGIRPVALPRHPASPPCTTQSMISGSVTPLMLGTPLTST
ncbi:hypothetical protein B0H17DRAFT_1084680, partial [Mycena rosella]